MTIRANNIRISCLLWIVAASVVIFAVLPIKVEGQIVTTTPAPDNATINYCFEYTWAGSTYDLENPVNGTCEDFDPPAPICVNPIVYTEDGSPPDTVAMWQDTEIRDRVRCRLVKNEVCAKWIYKYDNEVVNATYLCTKITIDGNTPMKRGCETQFKDGYTIEVCACEQSMTGPNDQILPCNRGPGGPLPSTLLLLILATSALWWLLCGARR